MVSILGRIMREQARKRTAALAERLLDTLVAGRDTRTMRQRAEHWCREAAAYGNPDDQFRLAGMLFNRVAIEGMTEIEKARRSAEPLLLLDVLIDQGYEPASELRPHVLAWAPANVVEAGTVALH